MENEMSEAKFTKGEWVKDYKGTEGHIKAISGFHGSLTPTVARFDVITPSIDEDEKEANAHLIAAAPELYAMLEMVMNILNGDDAINEVESSDIKNLLAKARGESC